jgi:hypothetical protein
LDRAGIDPNRRAETLSVAEFISLQISLAQIDPGRLEASTASKNDDQAP